MAVELSARQMALVRNTIAKDCDQQEFDLFMAAAKSYGLDPFRKQIQPLVFSKSNPEKRRMSIVVTRDGLRVIAQRCGNYRPASKPPEFEIDEALAGPANPKGIVQATVYLWQRDEGGHWWEVCGQADWAEFAPVKDEWAYNETKGKRAPTGNSAVDGKWADMPKLMIAKCAEAQALRAGWPDQFAGVYAEEELDKAAAEEMTASEMVEADARRIRETRVGDGLTCTFSGGVLEQVPVGQFADRALEHTADLQPSEVHAWQVQNRVALQHFWASQPGDALELKAELEKRTAGMLLSEHAA